MMKTPRTFGWLALCLTWAWAGHALANSPPSLAEVESALRTNNTEQLNDLLKRLSQAKGDVFELNFHKGLIQLKREQYDAAIAHFSVIPSSSPYYLAARNNIATIYAAQGKLNDAKATLEQALKSNQPLELMYNNLNNLKTHLASKNYASALQLLEPAKNNKLSLVVSTNGLAQYSPKVVAAAPAPTAAPVATAPTTTGTTGTAGTTSAATTEGAKATESVPPKTTVAAATPSAAPAAPAATAPNAKERASDSKPAPPEKAPAASAEEAELTQAATQALQMWAQAWEKKDMDRYVKSYVPGFTPSDGKSHAEWVKDRQDRILSKGQIKIQISQVEATLVNKNTIKLRYRQNYQSDKLKVSSVKLIEMKLQDQRWLITKERSAGGAQK
jgi:tetratricopeptide (TPR) repeat protein